MWTNGVENIRVHTKMALKTLAKKGCTCWKMSRYTQIWIRRLNLVVVSKVQLHESELGWTWRRVKAALTKPCATIILYYNHLVASVNWYLYVFSFSISDTPSPAPQHTHIHIFFSILQRKMSGSGWHFTYCIVAIFDSPWSINLRLIHQLETFKASRDPLRAGSSHFPSHYSQSRQLSLFFVFVF